MALSGLSLGEPAMTMVQKAEVASQALKENIKKLREGHGRTVTNLLQTDEKLSEALSDITDLEKSLDSAGEKYVFMQQLRDFISVICDFLKDKGLLIEELEEEMQKLHEQRAAAVEDRRAADGVDEGNEVEAAVTAAMSVLNKGSGAAYLSAAANAAQAALVAARESSNLPVQVDEFGRDVNLKKRMDFTRRAEARKRRRARAESNLMSLSSAGKDSSFNQVEGEVTTDESDSESSAYKSTRDELLQTAEQIFSDASDEYSNLSIVKEKFEMWKKQHSSSYRDAYMSLSAPNVFSPYVRLELLKWDPLYNMTDFYDMEWHKLLFDYGLPGEGLDLDPDDPDTNLIPVLVEKVALPILHHEVEHCWDIFSTRRTENAVYATNLVISYIPASSEALAELLKVICRRLTQAIAGLGVPVWRPEVMRVVPGAAQFVAYRFGTSVRLLRNVCLWKDVVSLPVLEKLVLEDLLSGKLLPHVRSIMSNIHDAITRMERIVASLSGVWYGPKVTTDHSQKLKPLIDCVAELGRKLEKRQASGLSEEETVGLARRLKTILVQLNEYDRARAMLRTFHLKEAL
ncbi:transcriptional repressor ILP1-like [Iris pallida]|nr:transcriptional repressor ILP1-like [Iris pallida]